MTDDSGLAECRNCLCLSSRRAARAITRSFECRLRPHGIRITQFSALTALILRGPMTVGALAGLLGVERTTLTRNLALLETKQWIIARPGDDGRTRIVDVTAAGRRKVEEVLPVWRDAQSAVTRAIGETGAAALRRLAAKPIG